MKRLTVMAEQAAYEFLPPIPDDTAKRISHRSTYQIGFEMGFREAKKELITLITRHPELSRNVELINLIEDLAEEISHDC